MGSDIFSDTIVSFSGIEGIFHILCWVMDGGTARGLIVASLINRTYIGHVGALKDSTYNFTSTEAIFFFWGNREGRAPT
jgi:hypothetical protein